MLSSMTDGELRSELKSLGIECGPITDSTRSVYTKKLTKLKEGSVGEHTVPTRTRTRVASTHKKSRTSTATARVDNIAAQSSTHISQTSANQVQPAAIGVNSGVRVQSELRGIPIPNVSAYGLRGAIPDRALSHNDTSPHSSPVKSVDVAAQRVDSRTPTKVSSINHNFVLTTTPQRAAGHTPTRKTYVYYRDGTSDETNAETDNDEESIRRSPLMNTFSRVAGWLGNCAENFTTRRESRISDRSGRDSRNEGHIQLSDTDHSDNEGHRNSFARGLRGLTNRVASHDAGTATSVSLLFTPPKPMGSRLSTNGRTTPGRMSFMSDDLDGRFSDHHHSFAPAVDLKRSANDRLLRSTWFLHGFSAQVPNLILSGCIALVVVLLASYFVLKDQHGDVAKMADLQSLLCTGAVPVNHDTVDTYGCLQESDLNPTLSILGSAFDMLSRYSGEYHCRSSSQSSPKMTATTTKGLIGRRFPSDDVDFNRLWKNALFLIRRLGRIHFNLVAYNEQGVELGSQNKSLDVFELESLQPYYSGMCRVQLWLKWFAGMFLRLLWFVLCGSVLSGLMFGIRLVRTKRLERIERHAAHIRDLVAELVRMLQHQLNENEANPAYEPPYIPVNVLRQRLRQSYPDSVHLWPEIVRYVYDVETCIGVQEWRGIGEAWQWQGGTGWQGSALANKSQKSYFIVPPTECLKIRNMFPSDLDERGKRRIKRELLRKLTICGPILHIGLDSVGSTGLAYIKCANIDVAGRVYHSIHANYFDGRLLTVKFLRDAKYCLRFPDAHGLSRPLCLSDVE